MDLPASYGFRPPLHDDLGAVADVLIAEDLDGAGQIVLDADFLRNRWRSAGFDLATDAWVVVDQAGAIVAYGHAMRDGPNVVESLGVVHPAHRGRGLGSALFDRIEGRAAQMLAGRANARFRHAINAGDHAAAAILEARGLRPVRHFWHMEVTLERGADPGGSPEGIGIGGIEPSRDLAAIHDVLVDAFADDWGFHLPGPFDTWVEEETTSPSYDPTLWLLASEDGQPVGALTASVSSDGGWVDYLGVLPTHRGRGIAAALLRRSFAAFAGRGLRRALVSVDSENPTGATALYERVGMRVVNRWDLWERHAPHSTTTGPRSSSGAAEAAPSPGG
jgi:mycothiol synthase